MLTQKIVINELIEPKYESNSSCPHYLMELSTRQQSRMKYNIIRVSGVSITEKIKGNPCLTSFAKVNYGCNILQGRFKKKVNNYGLNLS